MITYKVTNDKKFYNKVVDLDLDNLIFQNGMFNGTIGIETENWAYIFGNHGSEDYMEEYGFKIVKEY